MKLMTGSPWSKHTAIGSGERRYLELFAFLLAGRMLHIPMEYHESGAGYVSVDWDEIEKYRQDQEFPWASDEEVKETITGLVKLIPLRLARFYENVFFENWDQVNGVVK